MPTGKVKWFNAEKGFGFLATDEGVEVFVHVNELPSGVTTLKPGAKVEFGIVDGRKGPSALAVHLLDAPPSVVKGHRKAADDLAPMVEDLIKLLDSVSNDLRRGRYPDDARASKVAAVLRAVADDLDV